MKTQTATITLFALVGAAVADDGWGWYGGDLDCAKDCVDEPRATSLCVSSVSSCISSRCASAHSSEYSRFASSTSVACSVYGNCGNGDKTQTVTVTDDHQRTRTATVTGCPTNDGGWGWGGWGDWNDKGHDNDDDDDDDDNDHDDHDRDHDVEDWCKDRDDWDCSATGRPTTISITRDGSGSATVSVVTNTVVVAHSGSLTTTTTFAPAQAAATNGGNNDDDSGAAAGLHVQMSGAFLGLVVAVAGLM